MENTVVGNVCQDPILRQAHRGAQPSATFTVAVNNYRRLGLDVVQRAPVFHRVMCYGALAENVANSLRRGMEVVAVGEWVDNSYTDEQGQRRVYIAMEAKSVGAGLRWATAQVQKVDRKADREEPVLMDKPVVTPPADRPLAAVPDRPGGDQDDGDPAPPEPGGRRRTALHRRKQPEPEAEVAARAG
jgi:single-strand DNA-binding protein